MSETIMHRCSECGREPDTDLSGQPVYWGGPGPLCRGCWLARRSAEAAKVESSAISERDACLAAATAKIIELSEQLESSAADVRSLARELLLVRLREWSEDVWCAGWGFGSQRHPREAIVDELKERGFSGDSACAMAAARILTLAELAGGWWVSPTEFQEEA